MPCPSHPPWLDHPILVLKILITPSPSLSLSLWALQSMKGLDLCFYSFLIIHS
jgi:hypothetical protein